jgi:Ni/Fe-hydrogenase subunit HybB-like protein
MSGSSTSLRNRTLIKDILWVFVFVGSVAAILRFATGLGYVTGMNDTTPWGLWIAFKLVFVAMAGGGFVLAGVVYIFHLETYRSVLRPAILIALLGYGSFVVSLLFDLGLPWHIYMPIIRWQHHSVMFEIAWCVILYFTVLNLEFGPVILEHPWLQHPIFRWASWVLHKATIPIVIAGIALSTLHQSSLGSLFLIMPFRVHPLWYSPLIPVFFLISAIGLGLMVLVLEEFVAVRLFRRELHMDLLSRLGASAGVVLWIYIALRLGDLTARGVIPASLDGSWQSILFAAEICIGGILPAALLMIPKVRNSREGLITAGLLTAFGVINQRMSLSLFTMWRPDGASYTPTGLEVAIAFGIPAAAGLIYIFFSENLAVSELGLPDRQVSPYAKPRFDRSTWVLIENTISNSVIRRSGLAVLVIALTIAALPSGVMTAKHMPATPAHAARGWEVMAIDGNQAEDVVYFDHVGHQSRLVEQFATGQHAVCSTCHHLSNPGDEVTACWECHRDMYLPESIFDHSLHQVELGGNAACVKCHVGEHVPNTAKPCQECHETMAPEAGETMFNYLAPGYKDAMHGTCVTCHEQEAKAQGRPELSWCPACHQLDEDTPGVKMALNH